jgi:CDP-L-myo-inositol myo-inositolphosphotransferase
LSSKPTDGIISRYINRKISNRISDFIISKKSEISPTSITIIVFFLSLTPLIFFLTNNPILAGTLIEVASILDGVDGEIARKTGKTSMKGAILDSILDRIVNITIYSGGMIYLYTHGTQPFSLIIWGSLALSGDLMVSYIHSKIREVTGKHPIEQGRFPNIASRDIRLFILFIATVTGFLLQGYMIIATISYAYVGARTIEALKY